MIQSYKTLRIYSYENPNNLEEEYLNRLESISAAKLPLSIYPYSRQQGIKIRQENYPLFYLYTNEIVLLIEQISKNSKELASYLDTTRITSLQKDFLLRRQLINEIHSSNQIEGVKSTRKEIQEAYKSLEDNKSIRFKEIIRMYHYLIKGEVATLNNLSDIREIYDLLLIDEIDEDKHPDGDRFRAEPVFIQGNTEKIHEGDKDEEEINENLIKLIQFNKTSDLPQTLKPIIFHYFFEYVHPFYDGNGRLGRYLLSSDLSENFDLFTGISFSNSVFNHRSKYLKAFRETSELRNKGDLTPFIISMLEIIQDGQFITLKIIQKTILVMKYLEQKIEEFNLVSEDEKHVLYNYLQENKFGYGDGLSNQEIVNNTGLSNYKVRKATKKLEELGYLKNTKMRPLIYKPNDELLASLE